MPAPLAYIFLFGENEYKVVEDKMRPLWKEFHLADTINYSTRQQITPKQFFDAYRKAYREEQ